MHLNGFVAEQRDQVEIHWIVFRLRCIDLDKGGKKGGKLVS
jgi:hypothetical protein